MSNAHSIESGGVGGEGVSRLTDLLGIPLDLYQIP